MKHRFVWMAGVLTLALSMMVSACGGKAANSGGSSPGSSTPTPAASTPKSTDPGVSDKEIVIGTFGPLTGPAAAWADTLKGLEAYANYINDQGGVNGRKIKVIIEDDQYEPSKTVAATKKLVEQDKVFALVNVIGTSNLSAVQDYLMQNKVPVILYSTGSTKFQNPVNPYFFAGLMPYDLEAKILMKYAVDQLKLGKFAVFYQNDDFGKDGLKGAKAAADKLKATITAEVAYNPTDVDVSAYVLKMKDSGAQGVLIWGTVKHAALVIKEAKKIGYEPKWFLSSVSAGFQLPELTGGASDGVYTVGASANLDNKDNPVVKLYLENQAKYLKGAPNTTQLAGWNTGYVFVEALKRAGPEPTRAKLIEAMESLKDFQALSKLTFDKNNHIGLTQGWVRQMKGTQYIDVSDMIPTNY